MFASTAHAQSIDLSPVGQFNGLSNITIGGIVSAAITLILIIAAVILFFILIGGGVAMITSGGGDPQAKAKGQKAVGGALIGLVIIFAAWAIVNLISIFFGVELLQLNIPNAQQN